MILKLKLLVLAMLLPLATACCAPKELFSCIDRNCFVADWMNEHSCVNRACYNSHQRSHGASPECTTYRPHFAEPIAQPVSVIEQ